MQGKRENLIGGVLLLGIGLIALLGQYVNLPTVNNFPFFFLAGLGIVFLLLGIFTHEAGWIIPGGILTGLGAGIAAITNSGSPVNGNGGVFLLFFAGGWVLITLLTALFTDETHWWALIPGGIMALVGTAVLWGGPFMSFLELAGKLWPIALIILGIYILFYANRDKGKEPEDLLKQSD